MLLEERIKRIEEEGSELNQKCEKLDEFLDSPLTKQVEPVQIGLMRDQLKAMTDYLDILRTRINLLKLQLTKEK